MIEAMRSIPAILCLMMVATCLFALSGCMWPIGRGDASGYEAVGIIGRKGDRYVRVELPAIPLEGHRLIALWCAV